VEIKHKTFGIDLVMPEILQGQLEEFEKKLNVNAANEGSIQLAIFNGSIVRTAAIVGWLPDITPEDVDGMKPGKVQYLSSKIVKAVQEAREVPPE